jgi:tetratricopeptide (TPR) repeat protein
MTEVHAMTTHPDVPVELKKRGDDHFRNGDYTSAIRNYLRAIEHDPSYIAAWNNLGYAFSKSGRKEDAARCREKIVQLQALVAENPQTEREPHRVQNVGIPESGRAQAGGRYIGEEAAPARTPEKFWSLLRSSGDEAKQEVGEVRGPVDPGMKPVPGKAVPARTLVNFWSLLSSSGRDPRQDAEEGTGRADPDMVLLTDSRGESSEKSQGLFSGLKNRIRAIPQKLPDQTTSGAEGEEDAAIDALSMAGGEVYHFQGSRSVSTIQNSSQLVGGFDRVLEQNPGLSAGFRGIALYSLGRYREALEDFDQELSQDPGAAGIWILRAGVLTRLGREAEALSSCEQALQIDPENFDAWRQYGLALQSLNRVQEALFTLDRALSLNPYSAEVWVARGRILHGLHRDHEALQSYDRALAIDPRSSDLWVLRSHALARLGREEEGLASLEKGIAANPDNSSLYICKGRLYHALKKFEPALAAYDRALTIRPDDARTWEAMGSVLHELGKYRDEAAVYDRAIAIDPENAGLLGKRGDALGLCGRDEEAVADFRRALEFRPGDPGLIKRLGKALVATGRRDEAQAVLRPILEALPDGHVMLRDRGEALLSLGKNEEALQSFQEAVSRDPHDKQARRGMLAAEAAPGTGSAPGSPESASAAVAERGPVNTGKRLEAAPGEGKG